MRTGNRARIAETAGLALAALLAGCGTLSGPSEERALRSEIAALRAEIASLNAAVSRLAPEPAPQEATPLPPALSHATVQATPQGPPAPTPENRLALPPGALERPPASGGVGGPGAGPGEAFFAIHLASYRTKASAVEGWVELTLRFPEALERLEPRLHEVDLAGRGRFYRLKAGPFATWGTADAACDPLREQGWICTVMDFAGEPLPPAHP